VSKGGSRYSAATYLSNAGTVAIAHNKVMIIDAAKVITGSFNFTSAAQNHYAENLIVLEGTALVAEYRANWERRPAVSEPYQSALPPASVPDE
jgi:phosphatidylserine/phosphatidylglycerophosphate/cardiolipin synthase-like enzyme